MAPAHVHGLEAITALNLNHTLIDWEQARWQEILRLGRFLTDWTSTDHLPELVFACTQGTANRRQRHQHAQH